MRKIHQDMDPKDVSDMRFPFIGTSFHCSLSYLPSGVKEQQAQAKGPSTDPAKTCARCAASTEAPRTNLEAPSGPGNSLRQPSTRITKCCLPIRLLTEPVL